MSASPVMVTATQLVDLELSPGQREQLRAAANETVTMQWFGRRIRVCFNQASAAQSFQARYVDFLASGTPDMFSYAIEHAGENGEPYFWTEPGSAFSHPTALRGTVLAFLVDAVTHRAFFDRNSELTSFHAAAVLVDGQAAAISAVSTGGKSTTAIACARRGMPLFTDERCVMKGGLVHPFPRAVNVRSGGLDLLAAQIVRNDNGIGRRLRAHAGRDWVSASFEEVLGPHILPPASPLRTIFFIEGRDADPCVRTLERSDAIVRLMSAGFCGPPAGIERVAAANALCCQAQVYGLTLGSPDHTALLVRDITMARKPLVAASA